MVLLKQNKRNRVLENLILKSDTWKHGYPAFHRLLRKPLGWLYLSTEAEDHLVRVDRKNHCSWYAQSASHQRTCQQYLEQFLHGKKKNHVEGLHKFRCHAGKNCAFFSLKLANEERGYFTLCNLKDTGIFFNESAEAFQQFLKAALDLAHKNYELKNFYETIHPRALALSTMHAVHRVISTAFSADELLPRIARLCMQILKVKDCFIWLVDTEKKLLVSKFSTDPKNEKVRTRKISSGIEGKMAQTGEICFKRNMIAVPFLDQEVIGVIVLKNRIDKKPFTATDLEIFRILSEQTVVAIKNAQLYDETQQLTLGSIKSITQLLELDFADDNVHLPLFARLVREIGMELNLSKRELVDLNRAVYLLDTGYVGFPENLLSKPEKLTEEEFARVKEHPNRGAKVLKSIHSLKPLIPIILHHHERFDGKGYPQGLKGEEIPIGARIVAVVDSFTAMLSKRPYRQPRSKEGAVEEIRKNSGMQFDPKVVESFLRIVKQENFI